MNGKERADPPRPVGGGHDDAPEESGDAAEAMDAEIAARDHDTGKSQLTQLEQGLTRLPPG